MIDDARIQVSPPRSKRVLITGVGRFWGIDLVRQLEKDHSVDFVCGIDTIDPPTPTGRAEILRGDIRSPAMTRLLRATRVDTVVHTQIYGADRPGESSRSLHDTNVIGTMNLLAAAAASPYVRKVVIRSSTSLYGASPRDPDFFSEENEARAPLADQYSRDIVEVETYARDYAARAPHAAVTILRFANSIGENVDTPMLRYLRAQIVPTWAGYDPRLQFVTDTDAVNALAHAVRHWHPGVYNIAGPGTVTLSKFLKLAGRTSLPVLPPAMRPALSLISRVGLLHVPAQYRNLLRFGRGVDTSRMLDKFGFVPEYTTREAAQIYAAYVRERRFRGSAGNDPMDAELLRYVRDQATHRAGELAGSVLGGVRDLTDLPGRSTYTSQPEHGVRVGRDFDNEDGER